MSYPIPLLTGVKQVSSYVNPTTNAAVVFAHMEDKGMVQLTQDYVTTHWHQRSIALPSLSSQDVAEFYSYTTHIQVTKGNGLPLGEKEVSVTSTGPCSVYINDTYQILYPDVPLNVQTNANGTITIIQETDGLGAICHLKPEGSEETFNVNPMSKRVDTMSKVKSGEDLGNVKLPDGQGLVPEGTPTGNRDTIAKAMGKFVHMAGRCLQMAR